MGRRLADMPVYSIASGLDYPSVGPEHPFLKDSGRVQYFTASDCEAVEAFYMLSRLEGIIPALESAHALAHAIRLSRAEPKQPRSILERVNRKRYDLHAALVELRLDLRHVAEFRRANRGEVLRV
jgi:tryptophan synthase beta subunit